MSRARDASDRFDRVFCVCAIAVYVVLLLSLEWPCLGADLYISPDRAHPEICFQSVCFRPAVKTDSARIFGFAEFISSLALLVIVFTLVDVRYRFRIAIAPLPLYRLTFAVIGIIGLESLLTEVWLADQLWLPETWGLTRSVWQACFGALFLGVFLAWVWYAFIRPPVFGPRNSVRYFRELYRLIIRGLRGDLAIIADELGRSATALVEACPELPGDPEQRRAAFVQGSQTQQHAYYLFELIANRKFCRAIAIDAPTTAISLFDSASKQKKYDLPMGTFAKNLSSEAIADMDSNLYHETQRYRAGLLGQVRPFSEAIFGDYHLVVGLARNSGSPLDIDYLERGKWTSEQWEAYSRVTLIVLKAFLHAGGGQDSFVLARAFDDFDTALSGFYKLGKGEPTGLYEAEEFKRFEVTVRFVRGAVDTLSKGPFQKPILLRQPEHQRTWDIYDLVVDLMFKIVCAAATIKQKAFSTWHVQYSSTWTELFERGHQSDRVEKIVQFKLRRKIYNEVTEMTSMVNFQAASVLGFCLSIFGLYDGTNTPRNYRALARALLQWTRREYPKIQRRDPALAQAVLFGSISFDEKKNALVKTYESYGSKAPAQTFLLLDGQAPSATASGTLRRVKVPRASRHA